MSRDAVNKPLPVDRFKIAVESVTGEIFVIPLQRALEDDVALDHLTLHRVSTSTSALKRWIRSYAHSLAGKVVPGE